MGLQPWQVVAAQVLQQSGFGLRAVTSEETEDYNCIAHAAGDGSRWWWPNGLGYWPGRAPNQDFHPTLDVFRAAFALLGYEDCAGPELDAQFEKIALYAQAGEITHAAYQLRSGHWSSKLGAYVDIEHDLHQIEVPPYGVVVAYMRRPLAAPVLQLGAPAPPIPGS